MSFTSCRWQFAEATEYSGDEEPEDGPGQYSLEDPAQEPDEESEDGEPLEEQQKLAAPPVIDSRPS
jgi:hypothetical protein